MEILVVMLEREYSKLIETMAAANLAEFKYKAAD